MLQKIDNIQLTPNATNPDEVMTGFGVLTSVNARKSGNPNKLFRVFLIVVSTIEQQDQINFLFEEIFKIKSFSKRIRANSNLMDNLYKFNGKDLLIFEHDMSLELLNEMASASTSSWCLTS